MIELKIVEDTHSILHTEAPEFDFDNPIHDPVELFEAMRDLMCERRGLGLAAPQCGISTRMFILGDFQNKETVAAVFNPKIVDIIGEDTMYEEGCLSYPGMFIKIKRPSAIRVRYTNQHGTTDTIQFNGLTARVFLHELDHLNGITFLDKANKFHIEKAKRKFKIMQRAAKRGELPTIS